MALHHGLHRRLLFHYINSTSPGLDFDTKTLIMVLGMLFASWLMIYTVLKSMVCWALRHGRSFAFETPDHVVARVASKGLKKSALHQIPIVVYGSGSTSTSSSIVDTDCAICLGEFMDGEEVRVLPKCNHGFHVKCIDKWLLIHSSCPNCRQSLLENPSNSEAATAAVAGVAAAGAATRHVENALGGHEPGTSAGAVNEVA